MMLGARTATWAKSGGMPTARDYVQDGLIAMWDGIENVSYGLQDKTATVWTDLIGGAKLKIGLMQTWGDDGLVSGGRDTGTMWYDAKLNYSTGNIIRNELAILRDKLLSAHANCHLTIEECSTETEFAETEIEASCFFSWTSYNNNVLSYFYPRSYIRTDGYTVIAKPNYGWTPKWNVPKKVKVIDTTKPFGRSLSFALDGIVPGTDEYVIRTSIAVNGEIEDALSPENGDPEYAAANYGEKWSSLSSKNITALNEQYAAFYFNNNATVKKSQIVGSLHNLRIYGVTLTKDQRAYNYAIDKARFGLT